jgi:hypothetical protein
MNAGMKVAILSAFPRIDRHAYKAHFLERLLDRPWARPEDIVLVYGSSRWRDYRRELMRMGPGEVLRKIPGLVSRRVAGLVSGQGVAGSGGTPARAMRSMATIARQRGVRVAVFESLRSPECLALLRSLRPDSIHNLSGAYVPADVLSLAPEAAGVVGGHYGLLPDLRGTDTVRWSIHLDVPLAVSHMALAPELDMGDILAVRPVPVRRGDTFPEIYRKCQFAVADGHLDVLDALNAGTLRRTPQDRDAGSLFHRMGAFMRRKVDAKLMRGEYAHYE